MVKIPAHNHHKETTMSIQNIALSHESKLQPTLVQRYPLPVFFGLVFGLTWPFMIADALGSHGLLPFRLPIPLLLVMGYMPTLAAVITSGLLNGRTGIRSLLHKALIWRVRLRWYLVAIGGFALICLSAIVLTNLVRSGANIPFLTEEAASASGVGLVLNMVMLFIVTTLVNGEEFAWRGFALPRLQARWNALTSSVILGVVWALFHIPLFFTMGGSSQASASFPDFLISTIGLSILFTWLFNNTQGSVLLAYLLHGAVNSWTRIFPIDHGEVMGMTWLICSAAIIVVLVFGANHLSRHNQRIQQSA